MQPEWSFSNAVFADQVNVEFESVEGASNHCLHVWKLKNLDKENHTSLFRHFSTLFCTVSYDLQNKWALTKYSDLLSLQVLLLCEFSSYLPSNRLASMVFIWFRLHVLQLIESELYYCCHLIVAFILPLNAKARKPGPWIQLRCKILNLICIETRSCLVLKVTVLQLYSPSRDIVDRDECGKDSILALSTSLLLLTKSPMILLAKRERKKVLATNQKSISVRSTFLIITPQIEIPAGILFLFQNCSRKRPHKDKIDSNMI